MKFQPAIFTRPFRWVILLLVLFIAAHSFSQVHASIHAFHEHSEVCALLDDLGNPSTLAPSFVINLFTDDWQIRVFSDYLVIIVRPFRYFSSRTPPTR